jgi:hypothetical protein
MIDYVCIECHFHAVFMETCNFHILTQMAASCSKLCHLNDKDVTEHNVLTEEGDKGTSRIEKRKKESQ